MSDTPVSLPEHLRVTLTPLTDILPNQLKENLLLCLDESHSQIPHSLLLSISKWSRTEEGRASLLVRALAPSDYSMISLLAGTITFPSSKFPSYVPPDPQIQAKRAFDDRKAITALMNALLSIAGAGYAAWWASDRTDWRDEWRVLFALFVAAVVAVSEGVLYLIWQSRRDKANRRPTILRSEKRKKKEDSSEENDMDDNRERQEVPVGLRKRQVRVTD